MGDVQHRPLGTENAPADWVIPGSAEITPKAIFATYDGTGAGGSFLPTLTILSDAGTPVVRIPMDNPVSAGSEVDATWGSFLASQPAASGGSGIDTAFIVYNSTDQNFNTGSHNVTFDSAGLTVGSPYTTPDNQEFDLASGLWLVGVQLELDGSSPGSNGNWFTFLQDLSAPKNLAQDVQYVTVPGATTMEITSQCYAVSYPDGGSPQLRCRITNSLGWTGNTTVKAGQTHSFMWGVRLIAT